MFGSALAGAGIFLRPSALSSSRGARIISSFLAKDPFRTEDLNGMEAIRADSIIKAYGNVQALERATISIEKGELFFLLGSSGCGKTTLLRCIAGLEKHEGGKIFLEGKDVTTLPTHRREAAMVFQNYALWPHLSVAENIAFGLEERQLPTEEIEQRVKEALAMVHLDGYGERRIDHMSGGQQQRVALARALVVKPKCLLLDEPLSNLDAKLRLEMRSEIRRIVKENELTAIYVTHDQEEALSMADRIAVMDGGQIFQVGTPEDIYRNPINAQVARFIGETNLVEGTVERILRDDGRLELRIATKAGEFQGYVSSRSWRPQEGSNVLLSIRPEALQPDNSGVPINRVMGRILSRVYLGKSVQYELEGHGRLTWRTTETNPYSIKGVGEQMILSADPWDVVILKGS